MAGEQGVKILIFRAAPAAGLITLQKLGAYNSNASGRKANRAHNYEFIKFRFGRFSACEIQVGEEDTNDELCEGNPLRG